MLRFVGSFGFILVSNFTCVLFSSFLVLFVVLPVASLPE